MSISSKLFPLSLGVALAAAIGAGPALAMSDAQFMTQAVKGNNSEVEVGKLALSKSSDADVKSFAQTLVDDHSKANEQAAAAAKEVGVVPPTDVTPEAKKTFAKLQSMSGPAFDKQFVTDMVKDHQKDIAEFKAEEKTGKGAAQKYAADSLPTLQKHLDIAKSLQSKMKSVQGKM
jgi:putative membrane protein